MNDLMRTKQLNVAASLAIGILLSMVIKTYAQKPELVFQSAHDANVNCVAISPDGKILASGSGDRSVKLWDITTSKNLWTLTGHSGGVLWLAFSPDGKLLASASEDRTVKLWDVLTGKDLITFKEHSLQVFAVAFSPDGKLLASGSRDRTIILRDIVSGRILRTLSTHTDGVVWVAFSPDGKQLVSGSADRTIKLWDVISGKENYSFPAYETSVMAVIFNPDGRVLASCGQGGTVKLWDSATGNFLWETDPTYPQSQIVAFSPDGRLLASCSVDGSITLWQIDTHRQVKKLSGHIKQVESIAFSPDGKTLVSGGQDKLIKLWDVDTGVEFRTLTASADFNQENRVRDSKMIYNSFPVYVDENWLVVTPDGLFDVSSSTQNRLYWRYGPNIFEVAPNETYFKDFYRSGLLSDTLSEHHPQPPAQIAPYDPSPPRSEISLANNHDNRNKEVATRNVTIKVVVSRTPAEGKYIAGDVRDVRLFRNGAIVKKWSGSVILDKDGKGVLEASAAISAGENLFTAYAYNHHGVKGNEAKLAVIGSPKLKRPGTIYIVTIGIDEYPDGLPTLKYAVADALSIGKALELSQKELGRYENVEVIQLLNQEASKSNIMYTVKRLADQSVEPLPANAPASLARIKKAEPEDAVILFFACHAFESEFGLRIIPHDVGYGPAVKTQTSDDLKRLAARSISEEELQQAIDGLGAGSFALILDTCYAGDLLDRREIAETFYEKRHYFLGSTQPNQDAREYSSLKHGLMTYALLEGLQKPESADEFLHDGQVTLREWLEYAVRRVPDINRDVDSQTRSSSEAIYLPRQVPRVFYKLQPEENPLIVIKTKVGISPPQK